MQTNEGAFSFDHTNNNAVEFFSKAGSLYVGSEHFYDNSESALSLFKNVYNDDKEIALRLLFWLRDCRGGAGNRSGFRSIITWLGINDPSILKKNIHLIPKYGRFDDLRELFKTKLHKQVAQYWADELKDGNILAAKWAKRTDIPVGKALGFKTEAEMRKFLVSIRKEHIVENKLTHKQYNDINYSQVPSIAMARYSNAFKKHDKERFSQFKNDVIENKANINTEVLFPHDCLRTAYNGDIELAEIQFDRLPNYINDTKERIIAIADSSGSMDVQVSGSIRAVDISKGLALYCSSKIPKNNPFHKKFMEFSHESTLRDWSKYSFIEAVNSFELFSGAMGSTRIDLALDQLLNTSKFYGLDNNSIPTMLLIISDMQFTDGIHRDYYHSYSYDDLARMNCHNFKPKDNTEIEESLKKWDEYGYNRPKIVYWNTAGYCGSQDTANSNDVALISGFSPTILNSLFNGELSNLTPYSMMIDTISKYEVVI